ncbi:MAG: hypothetical protein HQL84_08625 [Magnetococcales bacterium]|nr:hypothetical protein [Magnetococcales bacterium]MBF0150094.1 hypothetical protein [Magnetococcales bacterium]MBF0172827.1 hypothetical protein [Magnetococcales bacterium]
MTTLELITLPPSSASDAALAITVRMDGEDLSHHDLSRDRLREVRAIVDHFRTLYCHPIPAELGHRAITSTGIELFDAWLAPAWPILIPRMPAGQPVVLLLRTPLPEIIHLPWEVLLPPDRRPWIENAGHSIRRLGGDPKRSYPVFPHQAYHPLNILVRSAPETAPILPPSCQSRVKMCPERTLHGLMQQTRSFRPHLVILEGTSLVRARQGFFMFEDDEGQPDPRTGGEIAAQGMNDCGVETLIITGRPRGEPPPWSASALLACDLALGGIPVTIAWPDRVHEGMGARFFTAFLDTLAQGIPLDEALWRHTADPPPIFPMIFG